MGKDLKGHKLGVGLSQRKDGYYVARYTDLDSKEHQKIFGDLIDAKNWLEANKSYKERVKTNKYLVDEWFDLWISTYKDGIVADNTRKNYVNRYNYNIKPVIGKKNIKNIRHMDCQRIINDMCDSGKYSYGTIELAKITLHAMFKEAVNNRIIDDNPADNLSIKKRNEHNEKRILTIDEQAEILKYASNSMYYNGYALVLETGLRNGELGGIMWRDIDFDNHTMQVKRTLLQDKSAGGFYFGTPKTRTSNRTIPLSEEAISILKNQKALQEKLKFKSRNWNEEWDGLVFTTINGNPVGASTFRTMLNRIVSNINTDRDLVQKNNENKFEPVTMHGLRHTFATRCIEYGMQPKTLQKIMGHSNLSVTMDLYVHVTDEQLHREIQKLRLCTDDIKKKSVQLYES